jgi:hypothetical protein
MVIVVRFVGDLFVMTIFAIPRFRWHRGYRPRIRTNSVSLYLKTGIRRRLVAPLSARWISTTMGISRRQ